MDHLLGHGVEALEAEAELPDQKGLRAIHDLLRHDEARLVQRHKHVFEDLRDRGHATHVVERVLEARVGAVERFQLPQVAGRERFEPAGDAGHDGAAVFGVHAGL
ncbi:hypothetical protein D9M69_497540 [compost metagenome]